MTRTAIEPHGRRHRASGGRGFTLMELMIAVVVLAILLVATAASLGVFSPRASRADLHEATAELLEQVEFARLRAAMTNRAVELQVQPMGDQHDLVIYDHLGGSCLNRTQMTQVRRVPFTSLIGARAEAGYTGDRLTAPRFPEVTIVSVTPANLESTERGFCFRPDGRVTESDGRTFQADPATNLAAGEARIALRMRVEQDAAAAIQHDVVIPYNGLAKVQYQVP